MALATLSIDLEARLAKFEAQLTQAARVAEKNAEQARAAWARAGAGLTGVLAGAAGALAGFSLVDALRNNIDFLDSLNDMADATGSTIEKLSGLVDLAERTGTSIDTAETAVVKLNAALNDTDPNSTTARALKAIGLSGDELRKADPVDALQQVAQALTNYADDGNKARLVQELLGKSARELAPLLKDLGEGGQLNAKYTAEQAAEAEKFNKQMAQLKTNAAEAVRALTAELLPSINNLFDRVKQDGGFWAAFWKDTKISFFGSQARDATAEVSRAITELEKLQKTPEGQQNLWQKARVKELREEIDALLKASAAANEKVKVLLGGGGDVPAGPVASYSNEGRGKDKPSVGTLGDKVKASAPKREEIDQSAQALAAYVQQLQNQLATTEQLTEQQKALDLLKSLGATGEVTQVREVVLGLAAKLENLKAEEELQKAINAELERQAKLQAELDDALEQYSGRVEDARKRALTARLEQRIANGEQFSPEELDKMVKGIAGISEQADKVGKDLDEFAKQAARNIQDALGDSLESMLSNDFDGLLDLWANMLKKMAAQALAAQLGKALLGDFDKTGQLGGLVGQGIGMLGSWLGSANGNAFGPGGRITAFAAGGVFDSPTAFRFGAGQLGVMGEAGPEAVMPLRRGADGRLGVVAAGGGGGVQVNTTVQIQAGVTRAEVAQLIPTIQEQTKAAVLQSLQRPRR